GRRTLMSTEPFDPIERACLLQERAIEALAEGRRDEGERLLREAASLVEEADGPNSPNLASLLNDIGSVLENRCDYAGAEAGFRRAAAIAESIGPTDDDDLERLALESLSNLARVVRQQGRYAEAEPLLRRALERAECAFGPDSAETASALNDLGMFGKF